MNIPVSKYHGLGNDFILLDWETFDAIENKEDFIIKVCDRHTGIGADGLIAVKQNPLEMIYYNQDGSRAPMCGNGIRCFSKYCFDHGFDLENPFPVQTLAGEKVVRIVDTDPFLVQVDMGEADWDPAMVGTDQKIWDYPMETEDGIIPLYAFFMSTVHSVVYTDDAFADIEKTGRQICHDPLFSQQTNVNFVQVTDPAHLKVQTYERGCGVTLACGTGVCASALCSYLLGKTGNKVEVELKKETLQIEITDDQHVLMTGPAEKILEGEYCYD